MLVSIKKQTNIISLLENKIYSATEEGLILSHYNNQQNPRKYPKILRSNPDKSRGYFRVRMASMMCMVHQIVWLQFRGAYPVDMQINHIDGNKANNHLSNLELVTCKENINHAIAAGLRKRICEPTRRFTETEIKDIRYIYERRWRTQTELAFLYDTHQGYISNIIKQKTWEGLSWNF